MSAGKVTASSSSAALGSGDVNSFLTIKNEGTLTAKVRIGDSTVTSTDNGVTLDAGASLTLTAGSFAIPLGSVYVIAVSGTPDVSFFGL